LNYAEFDYEKTWIDFQGGLKFKALNMVNGHIGVRYRRIDNHMFFINSTTQAGAFDVILNDCYVFNFNVDLHARINDKIKAVADFAYNKYDFIKARLTADVPITIAHAWYKPEIELTLKGIYQMNEHWKFNLATYFEGKRYALTGNDYDDIKELKPIVDIQLGCDYNLNKNFAFYAEIKNLIHNKYQMYYNYPSYGIQGFVGFKYRFL
jgi:outer membrane cobalamin receptor